MRPFCVIGSDNIDARENLASDKTNISLPSCEVCRVKWCNRLKERNKINDLYCGSSSSLM